MDVGTMGILSAVTPFVLGFIILANLGMGAGFVLISLLCTSWWNWMRKIRKMCWNMYSFKKAGWV